MLQSTPGAIGAAFLDREGEVVELFAESVFEIGSDGLRAIGAYEGIFLSDLGRAADRLGAGRIERLTIDFEHAKVLGCVLKDGYYLVLVVRADTNEGIAAQRLRRCRDRLMTEL